jgi:hypothetical protein
MTDEQITALFVIALVIAFVVAVMLTYDGKPDTRTEAEKEQDWLDSQW